MFVKKGLLFCLALLLCACGAKEETKDLVLEYGNDMPDYLSFYLGDDAGSGKLDFSEVKLAPGKDYPALGEQQVKILKDDETIQVTVFVEDTLRPSLICNRDEIVVNVNEKVDDKLLKESLKVTDASEVTLSLDDSKVDYSKEGTYEAVVKAVDASANEAELTVKISVKEQILKLNYSRLDLMAGESFLLYGTIDEQPADITFVSSDESIASITSDGMVLAHREGEVIIKAEADGAESECIVYVFAEPVDDDDVIVDNETPDSDISEPDTEEPDVEDPDTSVEDPVEEPETPEPETPDNEEPEVDSDHVHMDLTSAGATFQNPYYDSSKWFTDEEDLHTWASSFYGPNNEWQSFEYIIVRCDCGKQTAIFHNTKTKE